MTPAQIAYVTLANKWRRCPCGCDRFSWDGFWACEDCLVTTPMPFGYPGVPFDCPGCVQHLGDGRARIAEMCRP